MSRPFSAVVFDLDDTLFAETDYVVSGLRCVADHCAQQYGGDRERIFGELWSSFRTNARVPLFDAWLAERGYPASDVATLLNVYRSHDPRIQLEPTTTEMLRALRRNYRLGLMTDGRAATQRMKVAALRLESLFDAIVLSDEIGSQAWKPDPRPYLEVAARLGVAAGECVYFADNPAKDFIGARGAGFASVRVRLAGGLHFHVEPVDAAYRPDAEVTSLSLAAVSVAIDACGNTRPRQSGPTNASPTA